jgi:hypothetical protein
MRLVSAAQASKNWPSKEVHGERVWLRKKRAAIAPNLEQELFFVWLQNPSGSGEKIPAPSFSFLVSTASFIAPKSTPSIKRTCLRQAAYLQR